MGKGVRILYTRRSILIGILTVVIIVGMIAALSIPKILVTRSDKEEQYPKSDLAHQQIPDSTHAADTGSASTP